MKVIASRPVLALIVAASLGIAPGFALGRVTGGEPLSGTWSRNISEAPQRHEGIAPG